MAYRNKGHWWKRISEILGLKKSVDSTPLKTLDDSRNDLVSVLNEYLEKKSIQYWEDIQPILKEMKKELVSIGKLPSQKESVKVIEYCVAVLDIVARYQDKLAPGVQTAPEELNEVLDMFNDDMNFTGRHKPGQKMRILGKEYPFWNISEPGEPVTKDTIYFGPEIGMKPMPASYWITLKKNKTIKVSINEVQKNGNFTRKTKSVWLTDYLVQESAIYTFTKLTASRMLEALNALIEI